MFFGECFSLLFSHKPSPSESPTCLQETLRELNNKNNTIKENKEKRITQIDSGVSVPSESPARDSEALVYVFWRMFFTPFFA
jgi:hypothetical protein